MAGKPKLVRVARVGRPHGLRGEVGLDGSTLTQFQLHELKTFTWRGRRGDTRPLTLETARPAHTRMLVRFAGFSDRDQAATLTNGELLVEPERLPDAGPGEAYTFELLGLRVVSVDGRELGEIADVMSTGANPVYVVRGERELLLPATPEVVKRVDFESGTVTVELLPGLEDL